MTFFHACTGAGTRVEWPNNRDSHKREPLDDQLDANKSPEDQSLRQSYSSDPSGIQGNCAGASSTDAADSTFAPLPKTLPTIVSGTSGCEAPSVAEMHDLDSQVERLA